jgi:pimeloyl-ACP methyl ester carboxylesterase
MLRILIIAATFILSSASVLPAQDIAGDSQGTPSDIDGAWLGTLDVGPVKLRLVFHLTNTPTGLTATLDSLDQGAKGLPVTAVTRNGSSLKLELKQLGGAFEGTIDAASASIEGTWTQLGSSRPLILKRAKDTAELEPRRPQNPVKPYPYREEDVAYDNKAAHIRLSATLTVPAGQGPFPAVLLLTGSGPQDRDESLMGHRPFLVLADHLSRHGIVVLRADDRGVGKSGGKFDTATTADFATDAEAGVAYLQTRPEVDSKKIGLVGHSEGGIIAPMVAARNPSVAFIVLMAGSGVPGDEVLVAQNALIAQAGGMNREQAEQNANQLRETVALVKQEQDNAVLETKLRERLAGRIPPAQIDSQVKTLSSAWFRYFLTYDPATALKQVKCPVLAINGEKDLQVPPKQNLPAIRSALEAASNKNVEIDELPGLNHLFQTAKTGAPSEYAQIEETMSPVALDRIARWILKQ